MTNMFADAKSGDEFVCRNGESRWFVGWTRDGRAVVEDRDGSPSKRWVNGRNSYGCEGVADIICRKPQPVTRYIFCSSLIGYSCVQEAQNAKSTYGTNFTIVRVTFTPGEDQE